MPDPGKTPSPHRFRPWLVGLCFWLALVALSARPRHSGNVFSRYMTVESIVERGTLAIERSPLRGVSGSPDVVRFGNHLYSDKPPVLSALAAAPYAVLTALGQRFAGSPDQFTSVNWVLVSAFAALGSALGVVGVRILLQLLPIAPWLSDLLALLGGFSTLLLSYGVTFNNHSVAAGLITLAVALIVTRRAERPIFGDRWRTAIPGLLLGLAAVIDLPAGCAALAAGSIGLVVADRKLPLVFVMGAIPPLALHSALQMAISGSPLPVELTPQAFEYPGSYWLTEEGRWRERGPRWQWGLEFLFGPQGWFTVTPLLLLGVVGLVSSLRDRSHPLRWAAWVMVATLAVVTAYYIWGVRRTDFAGQSFGTRHLLAFVAILYVFAVDVAWARGRSWFPQLLFSILAAVGLVYAWAGQVDPWSRVERRTDPALVLLRQVVPYPWSSYDR